MSCPVCDTPLTWENVSVLRAASWQMERLCNACDRWLWRILNPLKAVRK